MLFKINTIRHNTPLRAAPRRQAPSRRHTHDTTVHTPAHTGPAERPTARRESRDVRIRAGCDERRRRRPRQLVSQPRARLRLRPLTHAPPPPDEPERDRRRHTPTAWTQPTVRPDARETSACTHKARPRAGERIASDTSARSPRDKTAEAHLFASDGRPRHTSAPPRFYSYRSRLCTSALSPKATADCRRHPDPMRPIVSILLAALSASSVPLLLHLRPAAATMMRALVGRGLLLLHRPPPLGPAESTPT